MTTADAATTAPIRWFDRLRPASLAAVIANVGIVLTGGIVRVTGSGLGCPDWPTCQDGSVVPTAASEATWHTAIEFGNRMLTGVLLGVAIWVVVAHRRDLADLASHRLTLPSRGAARLRTLVRLQPTLIIAQAVLGGITVLTDLNPVVVAGHFVLSMVLIAGAVMLRHQVTAPPRAAVPAGPDLTVVSRVVTSLAGVVLLLGTVVTAAGPHAGDPGTPRLGVDIQTAALLHADAVWLLVGLTIALLLAARAVEDDRVARAAGILLVVELAQGGVGYLQYALGIPAALVSLHLLGATLVWVAAVRLSLANSDLTLLPSGGGGPVEVPVQLSHVTVTS